jgi:hypothetical protein
MTNHEKDIVRQIGWAKVSNHVPISESELLYFVRAFCGQKIGDKDCLIEPFWGRLNNWQFELGIRFARFLAQEKSDGKLYIWNDYEENDR